jgi:hypothetical protein
MENVVDIYVKKKGPSGRPVAMVMASPSIPLDKVASAIQNAVTRNTDLLTKLGLKSCPACISGLDLDFRHRWDDVIRVDLR